MTNKKRLAIIIAAVLAVLVAAGAGMFAYASDVAKKNSIGLDSALNIAMIDAGATEDNTVVTKAKMDFEKGVFAYDIEFTVVGSGKYDYSIKASDGTILSKDLDKEKNSINQKATEAATAAAITESTTAPAAEPESKAAETTTKKTGNTATTKKSSSSEISLEKAKSIALNDAGVSADNAQIISAEKDFDDGIYYYEIDFKTSSYKYEYEIDLNGKILSYDRDPIKKKSTTTKKAAKSTTKSNAQYIGVDKAKSIALSHAGFSSSKVNFTKAKLERDDGIYLYEIEFVSSGIEYEYEINATTGKIISYSSEPYDD